MTKRQIIGYITASIGIIMLLFTFNFTRELIPVQLPVELTANLVLIISLITIAIGILLSYSRGKIKPRKEVPIYEGEKIIGYRRSTSK